MIYIINEDTNKITSFEVSNINSLSPIFRNPPNREATIEERDNYLLIGIKNSKISELKQKRDEANILDMNSHQATELIPAENNTFTEGGLVYFSFRTKPTGNPATEPTSILTNIMVKNGNLLYEGLPTNHYLSYSCAIIEGESVRVGYVKLDFELAKEIVSHMELRNSTNIRHCNELEAQVEAATTIEEINNIVW